MLSWSEFQNRAPAIADAGRGLLYKFGPGLAFLATVRRDGAPRLHPICPVIVEGRLYAFILGKSPKCGDLSRDGRFALHTFPMPDVDDEFMLAGRAVRIQDPGRSAAVKSELTRLGIKSTEEELLF